MIRSACAPTTAAISSLVWMGKAMPFSDTKYPLKHLPVIFTPERELFKNHRSRTSENLIVISMPLFCILIFGSTERLAVNPLSNLTKMGNNSLEVSILIDFN